MVFALVVLVAVLVWAAMEWVRIIRSVYQLILAAIAPSDRQSVRPASSPQGGHEGPVLVEPDRPASSAGNLHSSSYVLAVPLLATAAQPDFESFIDGINVVFGVGGMVLLALGLVLIARRYLRP